MNRWRYLITPDFLSGFYIAMAIHFFGLHRATWASGFVIAGIVFYVRGWYVHLKETSEPSAGIVSDSR
jgi:hypothetical protein